MPSIFPTQLDQVRDQSDRAGSRYIDLLGQPQNNSTNILAQIIDRATKANESQLLGDALAAYQRGIENGQRAADILRTLDPRIAGSKEFQDRAGDIRDSHLKQTAEDRAQAQWANQLHRQALQDEANDLYARYLENQQRTNGLGAGSFYEAHKAELAANPLARQKIIENAITTGADISFNPNATQLIPNLDTEKFSANITEARNQALANIDRVSALGLNLEDNPDMMKATQSIQSFIDAGAKARGYEGDDYSDYAENVTTAFHNIKAELNRKGITLPDQVILAQMYRNPYDAWIGQDSVKEDAIIDWALQYGSDYDKERQSYLASKAFMDAYNEAQANRTISNTEAQLATNVRRLVELRNSGYLTEAQFRDQMAKASRAYDTSLASLGSKAKAILGRELTR